MRRSKHPLSWLCRADMYHQLAHMEKSGLTAEQAFAALSGSTEKAAQKQFAMMRTMLKKGRDLVVAGKLSGIFDDFDSGVIAPFYAAGKLEQAYLWLATWYQNKASSRRTIKANLFYPIALLVLAIFIMPLPSMVLGNVSVMDYLLATGTQIAALFALLYGFWNLPIWLQKKNAQGSAMVGRILLEIPFVAGQIVLYNMQRFVSTLGQLLEAGLPMDKAYALATKSLSNQVLKNTMHRDMARLRKGESLSVIAAHNRWLNRSGLQELILTGEQAGRLPEMLQHFAAQEQEKIQLSIKMLSEWIPRIIYLVIAIAIAVSIVKTGLPVPVL